MKAIRIWLPIILSASTFLAIADNAQIKDIPHPAQVEVQAKSNGQYRYVSELGKLTFPLPAKTVANEQLEFRQGSETWGVSRADVVLVNEKLVVDACQTIPATLPDGARSASVKGAGEGCP
jgi:hypothetical protein